MSRCRLLLGLLLLCGAVRAEPEAVFAHPLAPAQMSALLGTAARPLAAATGLRGRFEQRKYLPELPRPLLSTGEFLFARDVGVWWHTRTPFDSVFILTRDGARSRDEGGGETRIAAAEQPGVAVAARIFFALFALDFEALANDFETYGVPTGGGWQVGLRPKQAAMAAVFREAVIDGAQHAQRIELQDTHGDRTEILLPEVDVLGGALTPADRQRFD
ncbi:MAG: outer membrane lipoprotein carrier protein LolA [Nevskia sp.]|nr:outer membrane lipoprotein carrier protein LolA [Nevskia sp.]